MVVLTLALPAGVLRAECFGVLYRDVVTVNWWDGVTTQVVTYTYAEYCTVTGSGGGGGGGVGGGGGWTPQGPQPQITINSISDENPGNPVLYVSPVNVDSFDLYINGQLQNTFPGTTTSVFLPSLDPRSGPFMRSGGIQLMAYNANGQANASVGVDRPSQQVSNQGGMYVRYYDYNQSGGITVYDVNMTRSLSALIVYTNYDCATSGARNGRVFHWTVEDVLGWDGFHPTPAWGAFYYMSSLPYRTFFDETPCGARFAGPANQSGLCADPGSFAYDGEASATARIPDNGFQMGAPQYTPQIVGNEITVYP